MPSRVTQRSLRASVILTTLLLGAGLSGCERTQTGESLMAEAQAYEAKGDNKAALIQLKNAAAKFPDDAAVRYKLALLYNQTGDYDSAEKEVRKALSLGYDYAAAAPELAKALLNQGKPKRALDDTEAMLGGAGAALLAVRGDAYFDLTEIDKAKASYQQALAADATFPGGLIGMAKVAYRGNDTATANQLMERAVGANPKVAAVWFYQGSLLAAQGKREAALAAYNKAIALQPDHLHALIERAHMEIEAAKFEPAKADIDAAKKVAPGSITVMYSQALLDFKQRKYAEAKESLLKVLRVAPEHMPSVLLAGAVELNLGELEQAGKHVKTVLEKFPNDDYARKLLAEIELRNAQPAGAATALAPLLKDGSTDRQALALAGHSSLAGNDYDKASGYFNQASALDPKSPELHTSLGLALLGKGDTAKGISELEAAVALNPASAASGMALIQSEMGLKHYDKALAAAQALDQRLPKNSELLNTIGAIYLAKKDLPNARGYFEKSAALKADNLPPVLNLAQIEMRARKPEAAAKLVQGFIDHNPKSAPAMQAMAEIAFAGGHPDQAAAWLEKGMAADPGSPGAALQLGNMYLATAQAPKGLVLARKLQANHPANADVLDLLGRAQVENKDMDGALETYSKLVGMLPKSAPAHVRLARVHMALKNEAGAAADLQRAVALQPDYIPARVAQAEMAIAKGRSADALAIIRQVQKLDPKLPAPYVFEGDIQIQARHPELALPAYDKALALTPNPGLMVRVLNAMKSLGKTKEADARLQQWRHDYPNDLVLATYAANELIEAKQYKPAAELMRGILKKAPGSVMLLNNLAWVYQQDKDPRALETAEAAYKLNPENPNSADTLGWLLVEQGGTARALPLLQKAVAQAPARTGYRYHLAVALSKSGDKAGARKEIEKLLAENKSFPQQDDAKTLLKTL
ncbi:MAG: XrtA/PEP-CTERM system TPR-repeat protein PrsT [Massilia sp.]